uniref:CPBP family intramembrane glutamic endopeptidase n=1 Tax=Oculatella sp. LEGE 06141 TaxID=1828648 RepID=UPI00187ED08E
GLGLLFLAEWGLGWLMWRSATATPSEQKQPAAKLTSILLSTLLLGTWVSVTEELIFRGFLLNQLQPTYPGWGAAAIASLIFAVLHLVWDGRDTIPQLPGLWLMGMVLVVARWVDSGNLGLAWGLHAGWVWAIASFDTTQRFTYTGHGSEWLTGLKGKPLAGLFGILFLLMTAAVLWQFVPSPQP